jgi:hypothetical protein
MSKVNDKGFRIEKLSPTAYKAVCECEWSSKLCFQKKEATALGDAHFNERHRLTHTEVKKPKEQPKQRYVREA